MNCSTMKHELLTQHSATATYPTCACRNPCGRSVDWVPGRLSSTFSLHGHVGVRSAESVKLTSSIMYQVADCLPLDFRV
jgi:hypothetical protein